MEQQREPMRKLILKFNSNPGTTLEKVVGFSNSLGLQIESIDDVRKSKSILLKVVAITGGSTDLTKFKEILVRLPAVTVKEM